jgi:tetratricopeptide (TPR) repeat protein
MHGNRIVLAVFIIMMLTILSSGCTGNNAKTVPSMTPSSVTTHTPDKSAVDLYDKGRDYYIKGNYTAALDFFNKSISTDPKYLDAWRDRGKVLVKLNRTSEAITSYDSALALEKDDYMVWTSRGEALMSLERYSEALDSFDKALKIAPEYNIALESRNLTIAKMK